MSAFSESSTVQTWLVRRLGELGWTHIYGNLLDRDSTDTLIESDVVSALLRLNPLIAEKPERLDEILPILRSAMIAAGSEGVLAANERLVTMLRGSYTHKYVGRDDYQPVRFIDFDDLSRNKFVVSDEVEVGTPGHMRRLDGVLWVNGIPLVVGETKTPVKASVSWLNAARDLANVYVPEKPAFFASNVFMVATEGRELHYGALGQDPESWLMWGSTSDPYDLDGFARVARSVDLLLTPARVLSILRDFTVFEQQPGGGTRKLIPRYPQVEAAEAIHERVLANGRQGLVWHYQGTGKSLLMAFAALKLLNDPKVGGPTVVVVLDRLDLIEQIERQFHTAGLPRVTTAETKEDLQRVLRDDQRGIVLTTVFRFKDAGRLNDRDNIIVFVDEAHRTQEGTLGDDMRTALPNARFFGLTGTPIADADRNTFKLFGDPDDPGYVLNAYTMERSITDGSSVPVHVETRLVNFHLDQEALDEAYDALADDEGLTEEERETVSKKAAHVRTVLTNPLRIDAVCNDILDHYTASVAPSGMKAQVVAYDRELVVRYHQRLNELIAERGLDIETAVVMTVNTSKDEDPAWKKYELDRSAEAKVKARFNDAGDRLAILIVTAKLLTGFDAPIEQVMYLDKPLRRHTLFQAITRTNRRFTHPTTRFEKTHGLIVDYAGIGTQIGAALKAADPEAGGAKRPIDIAGLVDEFDAALEAALKPFEGLDLTDGSFEALQAARQRIPTASERDAFARCYLIVAKLWEILDPNEHLQPHKAAYHWLSHIYEAVTPTQTSDALLWHRLGPKTLQLVHQHIRDVKVAGSGLEEVIVDPDAIEAIRKLVEQGALDLKTTGGNVNEEPLTVKEVLDSIEARIRRRLEGNPHQVYKTLAEQIEKLRQQAIAKATDSIEFLKRALELARTAVQAERLEDEGRLDDAIPLLDPNIGALTQIVEEFKPPDTPVIVTDLVRDIDTIVKDVRYAGWNETQVGDRTVRKELRLVLKRFGLPLTGPLFDRAYAYISENY